VTSDGQTNSDERRTSFDRNAALYDAVRPPYHPGVIDALREHVHGTRLLEVGAGTGKATELLARAGYAITAIEPGAHLCEILRAKELPNVTVVQSTFEDYRGSGFDAVVAAQAWHWMPANRFELVAAAAPALAIVYNEKAAIDPALRVELVRAYERHGMADVPRHPDDGVSHARAEYTRLVAESGRFALAHVAELPWTERYSTARYLELLSTYSDHAVLAPDVRAALLGEIAAAIERRGGTIEIPYVTLVFVAHRIE
jgi:SAM-dependent methyltransferase